METIFHKVSTSSAQLPPPFGLSGQLLREGPVIKDNRFGASGGIGPHFITCAERGHSLRLSYRAAPTLRRAAMFEILVTTNIFDPDFMGPAIAGADLVSPPWVPLSSSPTTH